MNAEMKLKIITNAQRMMALFAGHADAYGTHGEPTQEPGKLKWEIKSSAKTLRGPTTIEMWESHIAGTTPLGVIPIREDSTCSWACIDVDRYDVDLNPIIKQVDADKLPLVCARSKSGGLRVYLFLIEAQPATEVIKVMRGLAERLDLGDCEIFPKQTTIEADRGDVGNWMCMPYFGSTFGGKIKEQVGLKRGGAEMSLTEFVNVAEAARLTPEQFKALAQAPRKRPRPKATKQAAANSGPLTLADLADGPPCLEKLAAAGVTEHEGRNAAAFHFGVYAKRKWPEDWKRRLQEFNVLAMRPPMEVKELATTERSLSKKDYLYTCRAQPMCAVCDRAKCLTRPHGVGADGDWPIIEAWTVTDSDDPVWKIKLEGHEVELIFDDIANITNWRKFNDECVKQIQHYFPPGTEAARRWAAHLQEKVPTIVKIKPPEDTTPLGRFFEILEDMLVNRWRGEYKEDLMLGRPWEDQNVGVHYFRMMDLMRMLEKEGMRGVKPGQCEKWIYKLGGGRGVKGNDPAAPMTIKGKTVRVWWMPTSAMIPNPDPTPENRKPNTPGGGVI